MFFVYILRGPKNHLYVGCTSSLDNRIKRHKSGDGAEFTKRNSVYDLVYEEKFETLLEARKREKQIKGWRREKKDNLIKFGHPNGEPASSGEIMTGDVSSTIREIFSLIICCLYATIPV